MQVQLENSALLTDLYGFTMAEAYYQSKMFSPSTFGLLYAIKCQSHRKPGFLSG